MGPLPQQQHAICLSQPPLRVSLAGWLRGPLRRELRDRGRDMRLWPRLPTAKSRSMPQVLLIGAAKSGTTSLYAYLEAHPNLHGPMWKEPRYFDRYFYKGERWYLAHFPRLTDPSDRAMEASTGSLFHPLAAERISRTLPSAKLIAILRNPIDRALSHHAHEVRKAGEWRSASEAFALDPALHGEPLDGARSRVASEASPHYLSRSLYLPQIERYLDRFDRSQLLVLRHDRFFAQPEQGYRRVLDFLELDPPPSLPPFTAHNTTGGGARAGTQVDREWLRRFFAPHNEALSERLGQDFTDWQ